MPITANLPGLPSRADATDFAAAAVSVHENYRIAGTHLRTPPSADGREHKLLIGLPYQYDHEPKRRYPVLYLCDGYWDFMVILGLCGPLYADKAIEEFIIVGLAYGSGYPNDPGIKDREHDLVPTGAETLGGPAETPCARYLEQLVDTFAPFVEGDYRVDPKRRVIAGASIGGAFALFALLRKPGFFAGTIALSPCLRGGRNAVIRLEEEYFRQQRAARRLGLFRRSVTLVARVFMAVGGADDRAVVLPAKSFDRQLSRHHYTGLDRRFWVAKGETHATVKGEGFTRGLAYVLGPKSDRRAL